jgi:predicted nucleotidyltransferase component of viral defense system
MNDLRSLLPETEKVLTLLAGLNLLSEFTFVGGSALSVYLSHRYSEDIDLFTWNKTLNTQSILDQLNNAGFNNIRIVNLSQIQSDFFIDNVKVTFFANGWEELKQRKSITGHLSIATLPTIAIMKINTLFMRAKFRDYYDLYVLTKEKHFTISEMYELAKKKMNNLSLSLFQRALTFTQDIEDESLNRLSPKYPVSIKQIEDYFTNEVIKWNKQLR